MSVFELVPARMARIPELLKIAQQRALETNLPYDGALVPGEAFEILNGSAVAVLVDVRTRAEIDWVGFVPGAVHIEWQDYPAGNRNPEFIETLRQTVPEDALILFICRSGARSHYAASAAAEAGFTSCYNVLEGFEGDRDSQSQRNKLNGWRAAGLPWKQG